MATVDQAWQPMAPARRLLLALALALLLAANGAKDRDDYDKPVVYKPSKEARGYDSGGYGTMYEDEEPTQLTACPNDCSFHGVCIQQTCHCDVGYSSEDCSYPVMAFVNFGIRSIDPPTGLALGGTRVYLSGFNLVEELGLPASSSGPGR